MVQFLDLSKRLSMFVVLLVVQAGAKEYVDQTELEYQKRFLEYLKVNNQKVCKPTKSTDPTSNENSNGQSQNGKSKSGLR